MEHNALMGQFVSTLLASRTQAHIFHLQTPSFAAHKALNEYYENIVDIILYERNVNAPKCYKCNFN